MAIALEQISNCYRMRAQADILWPCARSSAAFEIERERGRDENVDEGCRAQAAADSHLREAISTDEKRMKRYARVRTRESSRARKTGQDG